MFTHTISTGNESCKVDNLCDRVVHVDGWQLQCARLRHLLEFVRSCSCLFAQSANTCATRPTLLFSSVIENQPQPVCIGCTLVFNKPASSSGCFVWTSAVRPPPSSSIMLSGCPSGNTRVYEKAYCTTLASEILYTCTRVRALWQTCSMHHVYSSSDSPFHANTGTLVAAMAAAAWSCVEELLLEAHRT